MENETPEFRFFWERHEERALSKLKKNPEGPVELTLAVNRFKVDKSVKDPLYICHTCGSYLTKKYCKNCSDLMESHNKGSVYFVVEHFNGDDYKVVFWISKDLDDQKNIRDGE